MPTKLAVTSAPIDPIDPDVQQLSDALNSWIENGIRAGQLVAKLIDKDPTFFDLALSQLNIQPGILRALEKLGRGKLASPELIYDMRPGMRKLAAMPVEIQRRCLNAPVEMVTPDGQVLTVDVRNLSHDQAEQIFDGKVGLRGQQAQRLHIEDKALNNLTPKAHAEPFEIRAGELYVHEKYRFSKNRLIQIVAQMSK